LSVFTVEIKYSSLYGKGVLRNTSMQGTVEHLQEKPILLDGTSQKWDK
jgi:hypothetical protein